MKLRSQEKTTKLLLLSSTEDFGLTHKDIMFALNGYKNVFFVEKDMNDGSQQILNLAKEHNIPTDSFRVVGVNLSFCVFETVAGLSRKQKSSIISVPLHATNCSGYKKAAINSFKQYIQEFENVKVA